MFALEPAVTPASVDDPPVPPLAPTVVSLSPPLPPLPLLPPLPACSVGSPTGWPPAPPAANAGPAPRSSTAMATAPSSPSRADRAWPREVSGAATQVPSVGFHRVRKILFMASIVRSLPGGQAPVRRSTLLLRMQMSCFLFAKTKCKYAYGAAICPEPGTPEEADGECVGACSLYRVRSAWLAARRRGPLGADLEGRKRQGRSATCRGTSPEQCLKVTNVSCRIQSCPAVAADPVLNRECLSELPAPAGWTRIARRRSPHRSLPSTRPRPAPAPGAIPQDRAPRRSGRRAAHRCV